MAITRNELIANLKEEIEKVIPENIELDEDDLDSVATCVEEVFDNLSEVSDAVDDEEVADEAGK